MRNDAASILASVREKAASVGNAQRWDERTSVPANNASLSDLIVLRPTEVGVRLQYTSVPDRAGS